jgi:hypothetical protein
VRRGVRGGEEGGEEGGYENIDSDLTQRIIGDLFKKE